MDSGMIGKKRYPAFELNWGQARTVQKVDSAIHWINHYPADSVICFVNNYPLDS